ncbi:MAG: arginase family protein, partial [Gemmataceae bacterium]
LREIVADNRRETVPTRAAAYTGRLRLREARFETLADYEGWRERGRQLARRALRDGDFLLWLTGNHLGALPLYDELAAEAEPALVIQLDAHLDIHHFRDCAAEPTHGNFLLHVAGRLPPLVNVGHRDLLLPVEYVGGYYRQTYAAAEFAAAPDRVLTALGEHVRAAGRVFLDLDCDVFDPSFFPAVGRPVPFGLSPAQALAAVGAVSGGKLAGVIVSEFDPGRDDKDRSLAALGWLIEHLLLRKFE